MEIWEKLKNLRIEKGYTQQQVCDALNIPQATLANYETGRRSLKADTIVLLAKFYGESLDEIFGVADEKMDVQRFRSRLNPQQQLLFDDLYQKKPFKSLTPEREEVLTYLAQLDDHDFDKVKQIVEVLFD